VRKHNWGEKNREVRNERERKRAKKRKPETAGKNLLATREETGIRGPAKWD